MATQQGNNSTTANPNKSSDESQAAGDGATVKSALKRFPEWRHIAEAVNSAVMTATRKQPDSDGTNAAVTGQPQVPVMVIIPPDYDQERPKHVETMVGVGVHVGYNEGVDKFELKFNDGTIKPLMIDGWVNK